MAKANKFIKNVMRIPDYMRDKTGLNADTYKNIPDLTEDSLMQESSQQYV